MTQATLEDPSVSVQPRGKVHVRHQGRPQRVLFIQECVSQEPLGIQWISRAAKDAGHVTKFIVTPDPHWIAKLKDFDPDVIGFMCTTGVHKHVMEMAKALHKHHRALSIFGGHHPTFVSEIINEPYVDMVCRGEGEGAFTDLLNHLRDGKPIGDIKNLWVKEDGNVFKNEN